MVEMPYAKAIASSKKTPPPFHKDESEDEKSSSSSNGEESPPEKPEMSVQPTPFETKTNVGTTITPSPAGPVRLAYADQKKAESSPLASESKENASQAEETKTTEAKASPSVEAFFGPSLPELPKAEATKILSILSREDLKRARCVCKRWNELAQALK
jgi:F-box-like